MITEDYCDFEISKLLKEKGFNEYCPLWYKLDKPTEGPFFYKEIGWHGHNSYDYNGKRIVSAPTLQRVIKWIREKGFHIYSPIEIDYDEDERGDKWYHDAAYYPEIRRVSDGKIMYDDGSFYATPEQACKAAVKYCLENLI